MKTADNSLQIGATLENRYHIESILGIGGFGITYKAHDDTLDCTVVIKEYLPEECGARDGDSISVIPRTNREDDYHYGLEKYLEEARVLAKFKNPNIVKVTNFIKANGTAYIIMDFEDGIALDEWLKQNTEALDEKTILEIIVPVLEGLTEVHKAGIMHRDIKPGNIFLRKKGGPLLIDFGAARQALGEQSKSISAIISMGYAPPEQYTTRGKQGPYTDLYAVGAVLYRLITGETPIDSVDRSHEVADEEPDPLIPCVEAGKGKVPDWLCVLTDHLLQLRAKNRPQTAQDVLAIIKKETASVEETVDEPAPEPVVKPQTAKTRVVKSDERFEKAPKEEVPNNPPATKPQPEQEDKPQSTGTRVVKGGERFGKIKASVIKNESKDTEHKELQKTKLGIFDKLSNKIAGNSGYVRIVKALLKGMFAAFSIFCLMWPVVLLRDFLVNYISGDIFDVAQLILVIIPGLLVILHKLALNKFWHYGVAWPWAFVSMKLLEGQLYGFSGWGEVDITGLVSWSILGLFIYVFKVGAGKVYKFAAFKTKPKM